MLKCYQHEWLKRKRKRSRGVVVAVDIDNDAAVSMIGIAGADDQHEEGLKERQEGETFLQWWWLMMMKGVTCWQQSLQQISSRSP